MKKYEKRYHLKKHNYLYDSGEYYLVRAKVSLIQYFKGIKKNLTILEHGCGLGQNIFLLKNAVGYDVSKFSLDFCKKKGIKVIRNLKELKNEKFDIVFSCEVLEHLENPLGALKEMNSKLKEKGRLILVLPVDKWNEPDPFDNNQHLYNWNFNTITNLLMRAGFYPIYYKILRRTGFKRLFFFSKVNFKLYLFLTKLAAIISSSKHIKIIAVKK